MLDHVLASGVRRVVAHVHPDHVGAQRVAATLRHTAPDLSVLAALKRRPLDIRLPLRRARR